MHDVYKCMFWSELLLRLLMMRYQEYIHFPYIMQYVSVLEVVSVSVNSKSWRFSEEPEDINLYSVSQEQRWRPRHNTAKRYT
jgi:hypothetical protein